MTIAAEGLQSNALPRTYHVKDTVEARIEHLKHELNRQVLEQNMANSLIGNVYPKVSKVTEKLGNDINNLGVVYNGFKITHVALGNSCEIFNILKAAGIISNIIFSLDDEVDGLQLIGYIE